MRTAHFCRTACCPLGHFLSGPSSGTAGLVGEASQADTYFSRCTAPRRRASSRKQPSCGIARCCSESGHARLPLVAAAGLAGPRSAVRRAGEKVAQRAPAWHWAEEGLQREIGAQCASKRASAHQSLRAICVRPRAVAAATALSFKIQISPRQFIGAAYGSSSERSTLLHLSPRLI